MYSRTSLGKAAVTVHILEDDPGVSDSLIVLLRNSGYAVRAYPDAESFFRAEPPLAGDAVLVDLRLPGIDGGSVVRWLQRLSSPPRIIVITGQAQGEIETQLRGLKVPHILRKPLTEGEITAYLRE